jgi:RimJ/RimL family protein N-acetyltransferase
MIKIESPHLTLLALSAAQLETYSRSLLELSKELNLPLLGDTSSADVLHAINMKLKIMQSLPEDQHAWLTYWLIIPSQNPVGAGLIGFKGLPNLQGEVEIGYGIDAGYQNQGYMTEAVRLLAHWAFQHPRCHIIMAEISKTNLASIRVQQKAGARRVQEDGETVVYHLRREDDTLTGG